MARKTVITKVLDVNTSDAIVEFPQNRTLMIEQLTDSAPTKVDFQHEFATMDDVFDHYKPNVDIEFENVNGMPVKENVKFNAIKDFGEDGLMKNSTFLNEVNLDIKTYDAMEQQLMKNKVLRDALSNENSRKDLVVALQAILAELQQAEE
jgi:hypothetical protein